MGGHQTRAFDVRPHWSHVVRLLKPDLPDCGTQDGMHRDAHKKRRRESDGVLLFASCARTSEPSNSIPSRGAKGQGPIAVAASLLVRGAFRLVFRTSEDPASVGERHVTNAVVHQTREFGDHP